MRVVLEHTQGARAGLLTILGTTEAIKAGMAVSELPSFIDGINFGDHTNGASLVAVKRSYVLYRELMTPDGLKSFNPAQE
jgi:hypothetical protein